MTNIVDISDRKADWTVEDAIATAAREEFVKVVVVGQNEDGSVSSFASSVGQRDMLWFAEHLRNRAWNGDGQ